MSDVEKGVLTSFMEILLCFYMLLRLKQLVYTSYLKRSRGRTYDQKLQPIDSSKLIFVVWRPKVDVFYHMVIWKIETHTISCNCMKYVELEILCSYYLRIYHINYVERTPEMTSWKDGLEARYMLVVPTKLIVIATQNFRIPASI